MQFEFPGARRAVGVLALSFLCACSGGGDGDPSRKLTLSSTTLTFSAGAPDASVPAPQVVTATISEGVANIAALHTGPAIERVDVAVTGSTAQITVVPAAPASVGAGQFSSTVAVTAYFCGDPSCSRLEAGATQTINASYQVSPVVGEVAPKAAIAGTSASVVIRGAGFSGFAVQGVNFGSTPATEISVTNGTEIRAIHPALTAGSYPVTIVAPSHTGPITSTATLVVVDPVVHTAQALAWPNAVTSVSSLEYDGVRGALIAATDANGGELVRFAYASGAWQAPVAAAIPTLRDATLSIDASQVLAISSTAVVPVDPVTLALGAEVAAPSLPANSFLKTIAVLNTNLALITTGIAESTATPIYTYNPRTRELLQQANAFNNATARASGNGATIGFIQGDPALTTPPVFVVANATTGGFNSTPISLNQNSVPPAFDRDVSRFVLNGNRVFDASGALLGTLPDTTAAVVLKPDGKRVYAFDTAANGILVYDISETRSGEAFAALGAAVPLVAAPGLSVKMAISPDANTLFIAGSSQLVVQPTPAL